MNNTLKYAAGAAVLAGLVLIVYGLTSRAPAPPAPADSAEIDSTATGNKGAVAGASGSHIGEGGGGVLGQVLSAAALATIAAKARGVITGEARNAPAGSGSNGTATNR